MTILKRGLWSPQPAPSVFPAFQEGFPSLPASGSSDRSLSVTIMLLPHLKARAPPPSPRWAVPVLCPRGPQCRLGTVWLFAYRPLPHGELPADVAPTSAGHCVWALSSVPAPGRPSVSTCRKAEEAGRPGSVVWRWGFSVETVFCGC